MEIFVIFLSTFMVIFCVFGLFWMHAFLTERTFNDASLWFVSTVVSLVKLVIISAIFSGIGYLFYKLVIFLINV